MKNLRLFARVRRAMSRQFGRKEALRRWQAKDFRKVNFSGMDFRGGDFHGLDFRKAHFHMTNFSGADFRWTDFRFTNFRMANFGWTNFSGADFSGAFFHWASFAEVDFYGANFCSIKIKDMVLSGVDFSLSFGLIWAACGCSDQGEQGRTLLAIEFPFGIRYFFGCFSGSEKEFRRYIARDDRFAPSRLRALEFCRESFT